MAFLIKDDKSTQRSAAGFAPVLDQWVKVSKASATLPQTSTQNIFTVSGGRVLVKALIGEVTVAVGAGTTPDLKVTVVPTTGTAVDIATDVVIASDEVGTLYSVEGDKTALLETSSGAITTTVGNGFAVSPGVIRIATSESTAGATKWDCYFQPLDPGATIVSA